MKFGEVKNINVGGMQTIPIRTEDDKSLYRKVYRKVFFVWRKIRKESMSSKLDDETTASLQSILDQCEQHLGASLMKKFFYKDNTVYPKFKPHTKLYEGVNEVEMSKYENRICDVTAVLEVSGILSNGDRTSLQLKV